MNIFSKLINIDSYKDIGVSNLNPSFFACYLKKLHDETKQAVVVVFSNMYEANKIYNELLNITSPLLYQVDNLIEEMSYASSKELKLERLNTLKELATDPNRIVLTDVSGYLGHIESKKNIISNVIKLKKGQIINQQNLIENLVKFNYNRETIVGKPGDVAVRGFVVDIFPIFMDNPIRIEFFGDEIEEIKVFDVDTQRTIDTINDVTIYSFDEKKGNSNILSFFDNPTIVYKDYNLIKVSYERLVDEIFSYHTTDFKDYIVPLEDINVENKIYYLDLDEDYKSLDVKSITNYAVTTPDVMGGDISKINKYINGLLSSGKTVILCLQLNNLNGFLDTLTNKYVITDENNIIDGTLNIIKYPLLSGFIKDNYVFLTEYELFNRKTIKKVKRVNFGGSKIKDISKIEVGDYVVHNLHGIGIYNGIKTLSKNGYLNDYIEVLYAKGDKLYIPASKIDYLSKYSAKEGYAPKVNTLGGTAWEKTKEQVKKKIRYEAERLLKVQAERKMKKGFAFSKDTPLQELFESEFKYDMTKDQIITTENIKKDMESEVPMDHILCGDVGYGKTEVAFRCMFKAVQDSKQVMYLCPTTLLSKQQYESCKERFASFPVNIALLNRFTKDKEKNEILKDFKDGKIDILFGTHRILSKDVIPHDLGLLVVDEEQRFGVSHKEKIKEMKSNVDVLTLTATPIPRTLQMAILGIKNLSLIETPPQNRKSVQTYVIHEDQNIVRDIIYKEISRDGQVFVLYNKVMDIELKALEIKKLVPDAKVIFAHGKMSKQELEDRMTSFINGEYNVLVCTTIIETGIDIPRANSLIIYDADRFGLSQLYQIRGRVGRSDRTSYAYLLYDKHKQLNEIAVKRLKVIKEFTELGSGFRIASRDLSIRGAGDILGAEQAGFINAVGIDLYMKLLEDEIKKLQGIEVKDDDETLENDKDTIVVNNHIKDTLVTEDELKIELHKLITSIDSFKKYEEVRLEIEDRFGVVDNDMLSYMNKQLFENLCKNKGVSKVITNNNYIELEFNIEKSKLIDYQDLFIKSLKIYNNFKFSYRNNLFYVKILKANLKDDPLTFLNRLLDIM